MANTVDYKVGNVIEVRGFNDLKKRFDELGDEISRAKTNRIWQRVITNAFLPALVATRADAPYRTGILKSNIGLASQRATRRDLQSKYIAPGTTFIGRVTSSAKRPDDRLKTVSTGKRNKKGDLIFRTTRSSRPIPFFLEYGTKKIAARHYLRNALESTTAGVIERAENEIAIALDELTTKWK